MVSPFVPRADAALSQVVGLGRGPISSAAHSRLAARRLIAGRSGTQTQRMNAAPLTTIPRPKHTFAKSAFRVSASTKRQTHQPTRKVTTNPAIGIAIVSTYVRTLAGTLHRHTCLSVMRHEAFFTVSTSRAPRLGAIPGFSVGSGF
jgi:hypothetical protein